MADALARIDQPSMDGFNTYVVARAAREQGIVVALSGLGGDEMFGGYNLFRRVPRTYNFMSWLNPLPEQLRNAASMLATAFSSQVARGKAEEIVAADPGLIGIYFHYRRLLSNSNLAAMGMNAKDLDLSEDFQLRECRYEDSYLPGDQVASVGRLDSSFYLQNILLRDSDVFGMANSLEIRVPFLGRDLAEWALGLPGNVLLPRGAPQKYLLRKMCASLYTSAQLKQPKRGFALPFAAWLQGPLRELMEENLRSLRLSGLLDPRGIDLLRKMFDMEPNGPAWSRIWALVVLGTWLQKQQRLMPQTAVHRLGCPGKRELKWIIATYASEDFARLDRRGGYPYIDSSKADGRAPTFLQRRSMHSHSASILDRWWERKRCLLCSAGMSAALPCSNFFRSSFCS